MLKEQKNISTEKFKNFDDSINNIKERLALFNEKIKSELKVHYLLFHLDGNST